MSVPDDILDAACIAHCKTCGWENRRAMRAALEAVLRLLTTTGSAGLALAAGRDDTRAPPLMDADAGPLFGGAT